MKKVIIVLTFLLLVSFLLADLSVGLISYYHMNESSGNILDAVASNDWTNDGADYGATGIVGDALEFVAANTDKLNDNNHPVMDDNVGSISVWIKPNSIAAYMIVCESDFDVAGRYMMFIMRADGKLQFSAGGVGEWITNDAVITANAWNHLVVVGNGTDIKFYVNGSLKAATLASGVNPIWFGNVAGDRFAVGVLDRAGPYAWFNGTIDELVFWDYAINQTSVTALWRDGTCWPYPFEEIPTDTCTCAGAGNNWEIDMADYCNITENCDLTTGYLNFTGSGYCSVNATITTTNMGEPGATGILKILSNALIWIKG